MLFINGFNLIRGESNRASQKKIRILSLKSIQIKCGLKLFQFIKLKRKLDMDIKVR